MLSKRETPFLVKPYHEPVIICIQGRVGFLNAAPLREFLQQMINDGKARFIIDFKNCDGMDSTFMGLLAEAALKVQAAFQQGKIVLYRLSPRNLELVRNLGLHRLMDIQEENTVYPLYKKKPSQSLNSTAKDEQDQARMILSAHESLIAIDGSNRSQFQDVVVFLENQVNPV